MPEKQPRGGWQGQAIIRLVKEEFPPLSGEASIEKELSRSAVGMPKLKGRTVSESQVEMVEVALPNDANPLGNMLGGKVMHLIDIAGAIAAHRHSRSVVVTVSVDNLDFVHPIQVGQLMILRAHVTRAFHTSVEVAVRVYLEDFVSGERRQTSSAFVTYVALNEHGQPQAVPPVIPLTADEKHEYREALIRRRYRLAAAARAHRRYFEKQKRFGKKK